jgi:hypothetical protein
MALFSVVEAIVGGSGTAKGFVAHYSFGAP